MSEDQISDDCIKLYEDIKLRMKEADWELGKLVREVSKRLSIDEYEGYVDQDKGAQRVKKIMQRLAKGDHKPTKKTFENLVLIREVITNHDDYNDAIIKDGGGGLATFLAGLRKEVRAIDRAREDIEGKERDEDEADAINDQSCDDAETGECPTFEDYGYEDD